MVFEKIERILTRETLDDRYWNQAVHNGVNTAAARLEERAYKYLTKQDVSLFLLKKATRTGTWFRTPLSQSSGSVFVAGTDMSEAFLDYIETRLKFIGPKRCTELLHPVREGLMAPKMGLFLSRYNLQYSYDDVQNSLLAKDCKEELCRQLSDQLVFCEDCGQKPILYTVIRDEDSMKRHLKDHKGESREQDAEIERIRRLLLLMLVGPT